MKVLLITYYWPPAGGSRVQRWLKFIKYFSCFGIDPIVYTVENPSYAIEDESLMSEVPADLQVIREPIWEPNNILSKLKTNEAKQSAGFLNPDPSFLQRQMHYIRANYFIPDARKYWIKPSVRKLTTFLKENPVDVIISTGPPHSVHMIGYELKKLLGIKWLADFRDPWTNIDYFHNLPLTKGARKKHHELEDEVLKEADAILVVGKTMREEFIDRNQNVYVVSNGFDDRVDDDEVIMDRKFSISHIGMMNADRNPKIFWQALRELIDENEDFSRDLSVKLIGKCDEEVYQTVNDFALNNYVNFVAYVATGVWHYYLVTEDIDFLQTMWPVVRDAMEFVLRLRGPGGQIYWAEDTTKGIQQDSLITGCSSIYKRFSAISWRTCTKTSSLKCRRNNSCSKA